MGVSANRIASCCAMFSWYPWEALPFLKRNREVWKVIIREKVGGKKGGEEGRETAVRKIKK